MIGEVVRVTRIANDFTTKDLSEKSQVSKSYINEIEKGKKTPSNDILNKLSEGFNLDIKDLLFLDKYHDSLIGKKEKLEIYRMLLLKTLETYEEKEVKNTNKNFLYIVESFLFYNNLTQNNVN